MTLPRITQFAGESFSEKDNVRTIYAGQEEDTVNRPSRTIVLVGPIGAGKSSLIDFMCNYFYGIRFDSPKRYKIADERFDSTTPDKAVTKYIFNGTEMPYRPIVIDTPGIGDPAGLKADRELASVVKDYFNLASKERIHAVGLVLPSFMHSVNPQIDSDIKLTLSLFPNWMHPNIVPIVTYSNQATATNSDLLKHFGLGDNATFCVDTNVIFTSPSAEPEERGRQLSHWQLTTDGVRNFLKFVGDLRPQTIERRLLPGDATPTSHISPSETLGQTITKWETSTSENVNLVKPEQTIDLTVVWSDGSERIPVQEIDEITSIKEVTVITERVPSNRSSPTHSPLASGPTVPPHKQRSSPEMRPGIHHRSDTNLYPYVDEESTETSNLELLRRYIYDPASRSYKIQYVHEVSVRESRRSSGRQSLHASDNDVSQPSRIVDSRRQANIDDTFLGNLADDLRRQGQIDDGRYRLFRNTSAPHLETEYDKENTRRLDKNLDYSPETLKRLLDGINTGRSLDSRGPTQISANRPIVIRKPYDSAPIRIPVQDTTAPLRQLNQNIGPDDYANQALRQAREQRSASHAVGMGSPITPDSQFDDKDRMFERSATARQSFHNSSFRRGGVKHAIATRPDTDYNDEWDEGTVDSRRSSGVRGPVPQPRTITTQPLRHSPPGVNDGQRVRPTDFGPGKVIPQGKAPWSTYPIQTTEAPLRRDIERGYRSDDVSRPLRSDNQTPKSGKNTKNRKFPSLTKCCFYVCAPCLIIFVVAAVIITLIIIA